MPSYASAACVTRSRVSYHIYCEDMLLNLTVGGVKRLIDQLECLSLLSSLLSFLLASPVCLSHYMMRRFSLDRISFKAPFIGLRVAEWKSWRRQASPTPLRLPGRAPAAGCRLPAVTLASMAASARRLRLHSPQSLVAMLLSPLLPRHPSRLLLTSSSVCRATAGA